MFDIGFWELVLTAVVALVVVGPERLPKLVRVAGLWLGRMNAHFQAVKNDISRELRAEDLRQALRRANEMAALNKKDAEKTAETIVNPEQRHTEQNTKDGNT